MECFVIFCIQDANKHMLKDNDSDESSMLLNAGSSEETLVVKMDNLFKNMCASRRITVYSHISWAHRRDSDVSHTLRCKMSRPQTRAQLQGGIKTGLSDPLRNFTGMLCVHCQTRASPCLKHFHLLIKPSKLQSWGNVCGQTLLQRKTARSQLKMS